MRVENCSKGQRVDEIRRRHEARFERGSRNAVDMDMFDLLAAHDLLDAQNARLREALLECVPALKRAHAEMPLAADHNREIVARALARAESAVKESVN